MRITKGPDTPPPMIGKIGRYTVFITPPATPKPSEQTFVSTPDKVVSPSPMVQAPPIQFEKAASSSTASDGSNVFGFFWNAMAKVQNVHSSLDEHLARWFGLNQSKYEWALDDYYETKGVHMLAPRYSLPGAELSREKEDAKAKEVWSKVQSV